MTSAAGSAALQICTVALPLEPMVKVVSSYVPIIKTESDARAATLAGFTHSWTASYRRRENQLACRPFGTVAGIATLAMGGQGKSAASQMYSHDRSSGTDLASVM